MFVCFGFAEEELHERTSTGMELIDQGIQLPPCLLVPFPISLSKILCLQLTLQAPCSMKKIWTIVLFYLLGKYLYAN